MRNSHTRHSLSTLPSFVEPLSESHSCAMSCAYIFFIIPALTIDVMGLLQQHIYNFKVFCMTQLGPNFYTKTL